MTRMINADENYAARMDGEVIPYLRERMKDGFIETVKGQPLYYRFYKADEPKAAAVMLHGFTEGIGKFNEMVWYFLQNGFNVWQLQQREHGRSWRSVEDLRVVNIDDFSQLVRDLHGFVTDVVRKHESSAGLPMVLYAHSMGGGVGACYLEEYPADFGKAVLSSPMLAMNSGNMPVWAAEGYARLMKAIGKGTSWMPGSAPFSGEEDLENSCSDCLPRYRYWLEQQKKDAQQQMSICTMGTALEFLKLTRFAVSPSHVSAVRAEVLVFQAGLDNMVAPEGQETFVRLLGERGQLVRFPEAKHEIYMCKDVILEEYLDKLFRFLDVSKTEADQS